MTDAPAPSRKEQRRAVRLAAQAERRWIEDWAPPEAALQRLPRAPEDPSDVRQLVLSRSPILSAIPDGDLPKPYVCTRAGAGALHYRIRGRTPEGRGLIVVFTGKRLRPGLPTAVFLQALPGLDWDVLMLRDHRGDFMRGGAAGIADSFPALVDWCRQQAAPYAETMIFGTSMGAYAALHASLLWTGLRCLALGAQPPFDLLRGRLQGGAAGADPLCACARFEGPAPVMTYSRGVAADRDFAETVGRSMGALVVPVPEETEHMFLIPLMRAGVLPDYFDAGFRLRGTPEDLAAALRTFRYPAPDAPQDRSPAA